MRGEKKKFSEQRIRNFLKHSFFVSENSHRDLIRKLRDKDEDFRHVRAGWLTIVRVDAHGELELNVLRAVKWAHQKQRRALVLFLQTERKRLEKSNLKAFFARLT